MESHSSLSASVSSLVKEGSNNSTYLAGLLGKQPVRAHMVFLLSTHHLELPAQVDPQRFDKYVQEAAQQEG